MILAGATAMAAMADDEQPGQGPYGPPRQVQTQPGQGRLDQAQQAPDRNVARVSLLNGEVTVRRGDSGDAVAAAVNAPLLVQDIVQAGASSRAEIQFDSANMVRLGANSEVRMGDLQVGRYQIQVGIGTVSFRVLRQPEAQVEIATPNAGVRPLRIGVYRVTVREDGSTEVTVREGEAEVATAKGSERLRAGSTMLLRGDPQDPEFQIVGSLGPDDFDRWNAARDRDLEHSRSTQYVSRDIYGAEDLDGHGEWVNDPSYGNVWVPRVAPGWAPYREGRWVWEDYYGWTWVSYDPWGWAPYHYGRWYHSPFGWAWYPGSRYERAYWSPALVGFFGFGGRVGVGIGFGFGNVGWVPLAPYERFSPWWGRGYSRTTVINNATVINNTNIARVYRNAGVVNGVSGVAAADFGRRGGQYAAVSGQNVREAGLVRGALPVTPDRASLRYADRSVSAGPVRGAQFYGRSSAGSAAVQRTPFAQPQNAGAAGSSASHGWRSFGEPVHGSNSLGSGAAQPGSFRSMQPGAPAPSRGLSQSAAQGSGGWSRFNAPGQGGGRQATYGSAGSGGSSVGPGSNGPSGRASYSGGQAGTSGSGNGQAVRISPSIVHDRSGSQAAPARSSGSGGGSGGRSSGGSGGHGGNRR